MKIGYFGKFLDQPLLISKFQKTVAPGLIIGGTIAVANKARKEKPSDKKKFYIQNSFAMAGAIGSALLAPKITAKVFKESADEFNSLEIVKNNKKLISEYLKENNVSKEVKTILTKAKSKVLNFPEVSTIYEKLGKNNKFLKELIPDPENVTSKDIFSEIGRLSLYGFIPVAGGITGGVIGDSITDKNWKQKVPNKIKEGSYQYLANIFLCNIGAGTALGIMEKLHVKSKSVRALSMVAGIIITGLICGSAIANFIGEKLINPLFNKGQDKDKNNKLYSERKPEALDICLHTDDIATVAVLSGLKWIEPALPILYSVSGYRAGIGYRNNNEKDSPNCQCNCHKQN